MVCGQEQGDVDCKGQLTTCVRMIESGVNPEALAVGGLG